jgi:hypothetical protein
MTDSNEVKSLLKEVDALRKKRIDFQMSQEKAFCEDLFRRENISSKQLNPLFEKGALAAGIDKSKLERLHQKDDNTAAEFLKNQLGEINTYAVERAKRRKSLVRSAKLMRRHFEWTKGNPRTTVCLWQALRIQTYFVSVDAVSTSAVTITTEFGDNTARFSMSAGSKNSGGMNMLLLFFDFVWDCDISGIMNVEGWLHNNSTYSLYAPGHCFHDTEANVDVAYRLNTYQGAPGGNVVELQSVEPQFHRNVKAGCNAKSKAGVTDAVNERTLSMSDVPVNAGSPIIASIEMMLHTHAQRSNASSSINAKGSLGITVPSIWLIIDH